MIAVYPKREQLEALLASPDPKPVVMLNLLRFEARAAAPDEGLTGEEAKASMQRRSSSTRPGAPSSSSRRAPR